MNVLKSPSFFRPTSRPTTPPPVPHVDVSQSRSPNKLSLTNLIRQSSSQTINAAPSSAFLVQDGSYLELLSLKLSEAVAKALAQPSGISIVNEQIIGKRPIPQGRGSALGSLVASELNAVHDNPHLYRAVLRSLQRPFSVLLTNLSGQLLPTLASPSFNAVPNASNQFQFPNGVHLHALSIVKFSEELLQVFDQLGLGTEADIRGDGLKLIRDGLVSLVNRVVNPFISGIRAGLMPMIENLENPHITKLPTGAKSAVMIHPSIVSLQTVVPVYAKGLTACTTCDLSHATLASFLISILWKSLVALSHRLDIKASPPLTPESSVKKRRGSPGAIASSAPPTPPPPGRFLMKLPPSRPSSPFSQASGASAAADCKVLYELLLLLPRPSSEFESTRLAREVVDGAFEGLKALPLLLDLGKQLIEISEDINDCAQKINLITADIPTLIALPIVLRTFGDPEMHSIPLLLKISEEEYRKGCLSGFGRAEECAVAVSQKILDVLPRQGFFNLVIARWLEIQMDDSEDISG